MHWFHAVIFLYGNFKYVFNLYSFRDVMRTAGNIIGTGSSCYGFASFLPIKGTIQAICDILLTLPRFQKSLLFLTELVLELIGEEGVHDS